MKKALLLLTLLGVAYMSKAQEASVEKSTYGIQVGFLGTWVYNEARATNRLALRSELGLDTKFYGAGCLMERGLSQHPLLHWSPGGTITGIGEAQNPRTSQAAAGISFPLSPASILIGLSSPITVKWMSSTR